MSFDSIPPPPFFNFLYRLNCLYRAYGCSAHVAFSKRHLRPIPQEAQPPGRFKSEESHTHKSVATNHNETVFKGQNMAPPAAASKRAAEASSMEGDNPEAAKLAVWKDALYQRVQETTRENDLFGQDELINLSVIPNNDKALLMRVIQALTDDKLFVTMKDPSGDLVWKWRPAQEAHK